jgi:hypothetical protein
VGLATRYYFLSECYCLKFAKVDVTLRLTVNQSVLVSSTLVGLATRYYFLSQCYRLKFGKLEVTLRLTVSQSVCLGIEHPCGACDQILLPVGNVRFCIYWAPSLTRGRVCNLQSKHSIVRVTQNPQPYFTVSSETPPNLYGQVPIFTYPRSRVAQLYPRALGSLYVV